MYKFELSIQSAETYDHLLLMLEEAGAGSPPGRLYHVAYGPKDRLKVVDIWDTPPAIDRGQFQEFAETLVPALKELGIVLYEPDVHQVHTIIKSKRTATEPRRRLLVKFDPPGMTAAQCYQIAESLDEAGLGAPAERLYHVCYREGDELRIISVWEAEEALRAYFDQLVRTAVDLGLTEVAQTEPVIEEVYHIIDGSH
ncbi:hypothetical protein [Actinopolymorpha rutila]|uniref:Uncharacterized protein n=1 Tax=Actinopolymorpha rutila TaxID=446787 RepID=A0A852ZGQ0_9ACTN|nr:hypothetical protein [Actinopolymorpha rutila]NYH91078.1 hypothetical protein [Actinopolymorpha rutila]